MNNDFQIRCNECGKVYQKDAEPFFFKTRELVFSDEEKEALAFVTSTFDPEKRQEFHKRMLRGGYDLVKPDFTSKTDFVDVPDTKKQEYALVLLDMLYKIFEAKQFFCPVCWEKALH